MENRISNRIKKRLITLLIVALALGNFIPTQATTSYAKRRYQQVKTINCHLYINKERDDPTDSPFLSSAILSLWNIKGDSLKTGLEFNDDYFLRYVVKKEGKKYKITVDQDDISKKPKTKLILISKKKKYKFIITIKLDHYDSEGNIIRSDGTFEEKGSWKTWITRSNVDPSASPTPRPVSSSAPDDEMKVPVNTDSSQIQRIANELAAYGTTLDPSRFAKGDIYSWDWAKPKTTSEQKAFDTIVSEIRSLCANPDATLKNRSWLNKNKSGIAHRCGQLVEANDTDLLTLPLYAPSWMSEQRKREIIVNLYFLDRTTYGPGPNKHMEDEDYPYQRILNGTYQGVCGRGAMRAFRILYCTNLGFVPHVMADYDANHCWLTVDSIDRDGTKFMRGIWITSHTFDMVFNSPLDKEYGWYVSYTTTGYKKLKDPYYYVPKGVTQTYEELGHPFKLYAESYNDVRYFDYWSGMFDILAANDMINF